MFGFPFFLFLSFFIFVAFFFAFFLAHFLVLFFLLLLLFEYFYSLVLCFFCVVSLRQLGAKYFCLLAKKFCRFLCRRRRPRSPCSSCDVVNVVPCCCCCSLLLLLLVFSVIAVAFCVMRPASCVGSFATSTTFDVVAYNECRPPTMPPVPCYPPPPPFGAVRLRLDESTATIFYAIDRNEQTHETKQKRKTKKIRKAVQEEGVGGGCGVECGEGSST